MMQRSALRSIYGGGGGGGQPKPKHASVVSPVLDESNDHDEENPSPSDEDDASTHRTLHNRSGNNWRSTAGNVNRVPEDDLDERSGVGIVLQKKSAQYEIPRLPPGSPFSNQEYELYLQQQQQQQQQHQQQQLSGSAHKYTVLGQKQKWRKSRAQRSRRLGQTISPVDDANEGDDGSERDLEDPSSSARQSSSSFISVSERLDSRGSYGSQSEPLSSGRGSSRDDSESSARCDSELSTGRSTASSSSGGGEAKQRFVVTRQKKSKYAARIHLPGQQNPLYLGRYKNEEAALAACESAYSVITTPRK